MSTARQASAALRGTRSVTTQSPVRSPGVPGTRPQPTADAMERAVSRPPAGGGGGGGGGGGVVPPSGGGGSSSSRQPAIDWRDASYNAQIAALNRALQDFETGLQTRAERYGQDFTRGVRDLGFRAAEDFNVTPNILGFRDLAEGLAAVRRPMRAAGPQIRGMLDEAGEAAEAQPMSASEFMRGTWDLEGEFNPFSAAARGTRSARDEFAGRGTLRSSDFVQNFAEFQDRLNQQLEAMETGRGRFFEDALTNLAQQRATTEERRQAAARDAQMRAAIQAANRR